MCWWNRLVKGPLIGRTTSVPEVPFILGVDMLVQESEPSISQQVFTSLPKSYSNKAEINEQVNTMKIEILIFPEVTENKRNQQTSGLHSIVMDILLFIHSPGANQKQTYLEMSHSGKSYFPQVPEQQDWEKLVSKHVALNRPTCSKLLNYAKASIEWVTCRKMFINKHQPC